MKVTIRNYRLPITSSCGKYWVLELSQVSQSLFLGTRKIKCAARITKEKILSDLCKRSRYIGKYGHCSYIWSLSEANDIPSIIKNATIDFCESHSRFFYAEGQSFLDNFMGENVSAINQAIKKIEPQLSSLSDGERLLLEFENYLIQRNIL